MKIDNRFISIPPYISTGWANIESIRMNESLLVITLHDGEQVRVPNLSSDQISTIFKAHVAFMEDEQQFIEEMEEEQSSHIFPFSFGESINFDNTSLEGSLFSMQIGTPGIIGMSTQHNPCQANAPDLPKEMLARIGAIAKVIGPKSIEAIPDPQTQCNCPFCQIARTLKEANGLNLRQSHPFEIAEDKDDHEISPSDLQFNQWEVQMIEPDLFSVTNKLDANEVYKVCLKPKVGCTCGHEACEHIVAVLKS